MAYYGYGRGRPRRVAVIDYEKDYLRDVYDNFYQACVKLSYSDCVALSHALDVNLRTVYYWRRTMTFPCHIETAFRVIDWVAAGKPTKLQSQAEFMASPW